MTAKDLLVDVLLLLGCSAVLLSCVALLRLPHLAGQLHGLAPAGTIGVPLVCAAVAIDQGVGRNAGKVLIVALVLVVTGPVAATVTARAAAQSAHPPPGLEPPPGSALTRADARRSSTAPNQEQHE